MIFNFQTLMMNLSTTHSVTPIVGQQPIGLLEMIDQAFSKSSATVIVFADFPQI
jgi:hypothetical protein